MKNAIDHTFVICAYKESPFLEACIKSLKKQTLKTGIIMITSTPNRFIDGMSEKYGIPLYVNDTEGGIVQDWNFGYALADTALVTIAHQDDVYFPEYAQEAVRSAHAQAGRRGLIFFSDYAELRDQRIIRSNTNLKIKRMLLAPLRIRAFQSSIFIRRRMLSLGSPICCPAVTYFKRNLPEPVFKVGFKSDEDWEAWEMISKEQGSFIFSHRQLMAHRIHAGSETSSIIGDSVRTKEDYVMFCKFWPAPVAGLLTRLYRNSEKSNQL